MKVPKTILLFTNAFTAQIITELGTSLADVPDYNTYEGIFVQESNDTSTRGPEQNLDDLFMELSRQLEAEIDLNDDNLSAYSLDDEVTTEGPQTRSSKRKFNAIQIKYLKQTQRLKFTKKEQLNIRKTVLTCLSNSHFSADRILKESTDSHKWLENHKKGFDYALLFMDHDSKLSRDDINNEDILSIPQATKFLKNFIKAPITKAFYEIYECCLDTKCMDDLRHIAPLPDVNKIKDSVSYILMNNNDQEGGSVSSCTQGMGKLDCKSEGYTKNKDSFNQRVDYQRRYGLETIPSEEEFELIQAGLRSSSTKSNGLRKAKRRPSKTSKKKKKKSNKGSKSSKSKKSKKSKKKSKKQKQPKWTPSSDGKVLCNGWKCVPNPNYDASKDVQIAKGPGDLTDMLGKISISGLIEHLAQTHGINSLNSFEELILDGNWIQGDTNNLEELLCMMPNLKKVSFKATNILGKISSTTFKCLNNLQTLDLAENGLFCIANSLDHLFDQSKIEYLGFDSNPMQSRCYFEAKKKARKKYMTIADNFDLEALEKKGFTEIVEFNAVMKECLNEEPNCLTNMPGLDPDLFS